MTSQVSLDFNAESKLEVGAVVPMLFGVVSFDRTFLVTFHVEPTAVEINGFGGCVLKNQVVNNQVKIPNFTGMFE